MVRRGMDQEVGLPNVAGPMGQEEKCALEVAAYGALRPEQKSSFPGGLLTPDKSAGSLQYTAEDHGAAVVSFAHVGVKSQGPIPGWSANRAGLLIQLGQTRGELNATVCQAFDKF